MRSPKVPGRGEDNRDRLVEFTTSRRSRIAHTTNPNANTSTFESQGPVEFSCSGAAHAGVPAENHVGPPAHPLRLMPKSQINALPCSLIRILAGFRSR
jgi:hypothetical protein